MRSRASGRYGQYDSSYASKGIAVCERWQDSFENFLSDMGECPEGLSLDRYPDNDGNYEPSNCRWATQGQQNRNKRGVRIVTFRGEKMCLADACKLAGRHPATIQNRLNIGLTIDEALSKVPRVRRKPSTPYGPDCGSEWMMY